MDKARQGEIALQLLITYAGKSGIPGAEELKRKLGNVSKDTGISKEELTAFGDAILPNVLGRIFGYKSVSLETSK